MLNRAFSTNHYNQGTSSRWKVRLCYGFLILILLSIVIIILAWNMLCGLPSMNPLAISENESHVHVLIPNQSAGPGGDETDKRHSVGIYYEVLCPDSRHFIVNGLIPAYDQLKQFIKPIFMPYGKAVTKSQGGRISISCQHGESECQGNMIHACAIAHVSNETQLVRYVGCMITNNRDPEEIGRKCAEELKLDWNTIKACWKGTQGLELLKYYGDLTKSLRPSVTFIPTIVVDKSQSGQIDILKNLKTFLCQKTLANEHPAGC